MIIEPFKTRNNDNDPDKAYAKLEAWLDKFIPVFLESPEYKKLSKANQKSGGSWFRLFMDYQLNYIGGDLCDCDEEDAAEILLELFPRKVISPDSQVKIIIPELIAVWQFLHRELNSGKKPQLEFAEDVISFLKSIKGDYLSIFKGEMDDDLSDEGMIDQLLAQLESEKDGYPWVDGMIAEVAQNLDNIQQYPEPPENWAILWEENSLGQFLEHILTADFDASFPHAFDAIQELLSFACQYLFMRVRQKDKDASDFWQQTEGNIMRAEESGVLVSESMLILISVLSQYRQFLSTEFRSFIEDWRLEEYDTDTFPDDFSLEDLNDTFQALLNEVPDEFAFVTVIKEQLGFIPDDVMNTLVHALLSLGEQAADALMLMVLDRDEQRAVAVASAISEHPEVIGTKTLSRLIRIRNWLAAPVQKPVDKLIRDVRKLGVVPQPPEAQDIQEVHMSGVDGAGAQGVMLLVKEGRSFRLISFVLKEAIGVIDVMVTPPETKNELKKYLALAKEQEAGMEKVSLELIQTQLPVFLALNLKSKIAIDHELVQAMELLSLDDWNPASAEVGNLYADLIPLTPTTEDIEQAQKKSGKWTTSGVGQSWFSDDARLQKVIDSSPVQSLCTTICNEVLDSDRHLWGERLGRMAVWAQHAINKRRQQQSQDYAVASWLLEHSQLPTHEIELLRAIAKNSIDY
ncbi:hypothetical protein [Endozoicomonas sp. 8E]|uniref:hypothetical protein n=1 Tax=Endozoicomonas sp. 8E TaxID=3035692 RepID=UPI002939171E|nr:hypothetical protein [Endozoicomonas sp. 8E]WOG27893.1 hypothetical protein P6910_25665 [Endozoicomonas sp. 8E]